LILSEERPERRNVAWRIRKPIQRGGRYIFRVYSCPGQPSGSPQTGHSRPQADMGDRCLYRRRHERNCDATVSQRILALARMHVSHVWRRASRAASRPAL